MTALPEYQRLPVADAILMERLVQRDSTALIELERRHRPSLYAQVYSMLMDPLQAERVVTDVFSQIWYATGQSIAPRSAWSWLKQLALDLARAQRARKSP